MRRAFKYRFRPTPEQADQLGRTFGCVRLVYNKASEERTRLYATESRSMTYVQSSAALTAWKKTDDLAFLNEVSSVPLQQSLRHLQTAYAAFFAKRSRYPSFKTKRKSRASAEYTRSGFKYRDGRLTLAKQSEPLDIVWSRPLPEGADPSTVTVSRDAADRWHVSILVEDPTVRPLPPTGRIVGLDLGITTLVTLSTGEKIANPRHERAESLPLAVRAWTCSCGAAHDRDVNAARNIVAAGLEER